MLICNKEKKKHCEDCYSLFKDKPSSFCTTWFKLDPQGRRKGGGADGECEEKTKRLRT